MKTNRIAAIAFTPILVAICAAPAHPQSFTPDQCGDFVSYMTTSDGQCFDLGVFSELGVIRAQIAALDREITPILASGLSLRTDPITGSTFLIGQLTNQSSRDLYVNAGTFTLTRRVDGRVERYATVEVPIIAQLAPGESTPVDRLINVAPQRGTAIRLDSTEAWER